MATFEGEAHRGLVIARGVDPGYLGSHVDGWEFAVAPYVWMAGLDGDVTVKGTKASVLKLLMK